MIVLTLCSSMPSAETFMKPAGSTRVTLPLTAGRPSRRRAPARRADLDGIGREQIGDHFEVERIADVDQRRAGRNDRFALLHDLSTRPVTGARIWTQQICWPSAPTLAERAAALARSLRRTPSCAFALASAASLVSTSSFAFSSALAEIASAGKRLGALSSSARTPAPPHPADLGLGEPDRRSAAATRACSSSCVRTSRKPAGRLHDGDDGLVRNHLVAEHGVRVLNTFPADRRGHRIDMADACLGLVVDRHLHRPGVTVAMSTATGRGQANQASPPMITAATRISAPASTTHVHGQSRVFRTVTGPAGRRGATIKSADITAPP